MRLIFAGTPLFACHALRRLCDADHKIELVLTQPDRPAGRGMKMHPSPVKLFALERGLTLAQPRGLRLEGAFAADAAAARQAMIAARADAMVVAAYGLILPRWVLELMQLPGHVAGPPWGCINIHASLLPRWRGAAPIQRAIEAGDARTGVTIMQMDAGLDTGAILLAKAVDIEHEGPAADTAASLHDKLSVLGAQLLLDAMDGLARGCLLARAQPAAGVSYADKIDKTQAEIDWSANAQVIDRQLRAFNPVPGAWTELGADVVKLWRADVGTATGDTASRCGTILSVGPGAIEVACGVGTLRLHELQRAGGKRLGADDFVRGLRLRPGMRFGQQPGN